MDRFVCNARTAEVGRLVGASILVDLRFRVFEQCVEKAVYHNSDADIKQIFKDCLGILQDCIEAERLLKLS